MKKLTKAQEKQLAELLADVDAAQENLRDEVACFNTIVAREWAVLEAAINKFNEDRVQAFASVEEARNAAEEALENLNALREEVHSDQESFYDEKSEKWQEGDAGSTFAEWRDRWSDAPEVDLSAFEDAPDDVEVSEPEELESPDESWADQISEALPVDVDGEFATWTPHKPAVTKKANAPGATIQDVVDDARAEEHAASFRRVPFGVECASCGIFYNDPAPDECFKCKDAEQEKSSKAEAAS